MAEPLSEAPWCPLCGLDLEAGVCPGCEGIEPTAGDDWAAATPPAEPRPMPVWLIPAAMLYSSLAIASFGAAIVLTVLASVVMLAYGVAVLIRSHRSSTSSPLGRRAKEES